MFSSSSEGEGRDKVIQRSSRFNSFIKHFAIYTIASILTASRYIISTGIYPGVPYRLDLPGKHPEENVQEAS